MNTSTDAQPWAGEVRLGEQAMRFVGRIGSGGQHRHYAAQLIVALDGQISWWTPDRGFERGSGALIRPNALHMINCRDATVAALYVSPVSRVGRAILGVGQQSSTLLDDAMTARLIRRVMQDQFDAEGIAADICAYGHPRSTDSRMVRLLKALQRMTELPRSIEELSRFACLSPSRFAHVFSGAFLAPVRPYLRFLRLNRAMFAAMSGTPLSAAAIDAGFSDTSHFNRTLLHHVGCQPTLLVRQIRVIANPAPY